jgi:hypothetical protein
MHTGHEIHTTEQEQQHTAYAAAGNMEGQAKDTNVPGMTAI